MGKLDIDAKQYFGIAAHFADAFNFLLYDGKQVIDPDQLKELDAAEIALPFKDKDRDRIQRQRDLLRAMTDGKTVYVILGSELQDRIHYAMPVKNGLYDMIDYSAQVEKNQDTDIDKVIEERRHRKVSPETAFFLKAAANLDLDFEIEDGGVDMCASLERKYKEKEVSTAIDIYRDYGDTEEDIISKVMAKYNVTKEYVQALLNPKVTAL